MSAPFLAGNESKPDFFVARATSRTFKTFCLQSQGQLFTFMENPTIGIAAKF